MPTNKRMIKMRKIGEKPLSAIPAERKPMDVHLNNIRNKAKNVEVTCRNDNCDKKWLISVNKLRACGSDNLSCYSCYQKNKKEVNQAIIALAKRRGLI